MKWILRVTKITAYVSQCANAIAKASQVLADNWPSDNPFRSTTNSNVNETKGLAVGDQK